RPWREPDARNPHVRFDEGEGSGGHWSCTFHPVLSSLLYRFHFRVPPFNHQPSIGPVRSLLPIRVHPVLSAVKILLPPFSPLAPIKEWCPSVVFCSPYPPFFLLSSTFCVAGSPFTPSAPPPSPPVPFSLSAFIRSYPRLKFFFLRSLRFLCKKFVSIRGLL